MALETFAPPVVPQVGSSGQTVYRVRGLVFGDGYTQRTGDGLNTRSRDVTLTWATIAPAQADSIVAFMDARAGIEAFLYTPPRETVARKFVCQRIDRQHATRTHDSLTLSLAEVFDLG